MFGAFEDVMVNDLIPMIDATYRTIPDREHRAMAGLSMGGMQTFQITLKHLDLFSYIGGFSGGGGGFGGASFDPETAHGGVMANADEFNKKVRLLWLGIGTDRASADVRQREELSRRAGEGRDQARLLRVARHVARVADLAAQPARVRAAAVPGRRAIRFNGRAASAPRRGLLAGAAASAGRSRSAPTTSPRSTTRRPTSGRSARTSRTARWR